jgi:hypothetical protein
MSLWREPPERLTAYFSFRNRQRRQPSLDNPATDEVHLGARPLIAPGDFSERPEPLLPSAFPRK